MSSYKTEVTLNEKDSLQDMLILEKTLIKIYSTALTEGVSKGFCDGLKEFLLSVYDDRFTVFASMTERDYYRVSSAECRQLDEIKAKFTKIRSELA